MSSIGQDEHETLETLFQNVDLNLAETQARECFHTTGPGRPPRSPLGLLRAFIVMRIKEIRSLRELTRTLDVDQRLRRLCLIEDGERGYPRSVLSRFTRLVGAERLRRIIDEKVIMLLRRSDVREVDMVLDASFIKAWSIRHPRDNRRRFSDPDAKVGRHGRGYDLGARALDELAASIKLHGILQPLVVEPSEEGRYKLQIGKRRMAAARMVGLEAVPAIILDGPLGAEDSLAMRLVENLHREDLDPIDEAEAYATLKDMGLKVSEIGRRVGKERTYVSHSMRLLKLHPRVREAVRQKNITREHALALLRLEPYQQIALAEEVMEAGLTMQETRDRVRGLLGKELKWRLVPIRIEPAVYDRLIQIAPEGDVSKLLRQTVEKLISEINQ